MKILFILTISLMSIGCVEGIPVMGLLQRPGGSDDSPSERPTLVPSDEFVSTTFNARRWTVVNFNSSMPVAATANGVLVGGNTQNQTDENAFKVRTNYTTNIDDTYGDSIIGELHVAFRNAQPNQTGVSVVFANGKRMVAYMYNNTYESGEVYGKVEIYGTDGTTLLHKSVPLLLGTVGQCQEYKVAVNYNASSTAQWNVDFSDNCASLGYTTQTALDHASLGATDYVGISNGKARYELFGNRTPVASDSNMEPFFGVSTDGNNIPLTVDLYVTENGTLATYKVELLNWNFSVLGASVSEE